ncbi:MAG: DMT family transporter [Cellulomonadaceae bacterium]|nr:DMT family transporter [Cellulomonadaceae bacterium]
MPTTPRPRSGLGVLLVVAASLLFAVNGTVAKLAMEAGLSPTRLVELRALGSALVLVALLAVMTPRAPRPRGRELAALAVLGVVGMALVQWLYLVAISRLPVGLALLIEYTAPLLVALWARYVLGEQVRARVWWALALCLSGLSLVAQVGDGVRLDWLGLVAAGGAALSLASYYLLSDRLLKARDPLSVQGWSMGFAALFWVVLQPLWTFDHGILGDDVALPGALEGGTVPLWLLVTWVIVLGTVVPYVLMLAGVARLGAARTGLIGMTEPVAASAAAWLVLGESMTAVQLAGGVVVLAGVALAETARRRTAATPAVDVVVNA